MTKVCPKCKATKDLSEFYKDKSIDLFMKNCLYKFTFPNGKYYIGQTIDFYSRCRQHKSKAKKGRDLPLYHAIRKYGWENIVKEVVLTCGEQIDMYERQYIRLLKCDQIEFGYNLESGGKSNKKSSDITKRKISENHYDVSGENNPMFGRTHSEETKEIIRVKAVGRKSPSISKPVKQISLDGVLIKEWPTIIEASKELKIKDSNISRVCKELYGFKSAGGYKWEYVY